MIGFKFNTAQSDAATQGHFQRESFFGMNER
jgi:hypothetical protein